MDTKVVEGERERGGDAGGEGRQSG